MPKAEPSEINLQSTIQIEDQSNQVDLTSQEAALTNSMSISVEVQEHVDDLREEIKEINDILDAHEKGTKTIPKQEAQACHKRIEKLHDEYDRLRVEIGGVDPAVSKTAIKAQVKDLRASIREAETTSQKIFDTFSATTSTSHTSSDRPKLIIQAFNGDWRRWLAFKAAFKKMYIDVLNEVLSLQKKFLYLVEHVEDEALRKIQSLQLTGGSIDHAWKILCNRYDDKDRLEDLYNAELTNLRPMTESSASQLRRLYDKILEVRGAFEALGIDVKASESYMIHRLRACFDETTRQYYENFAIMKKDGKGSETPWERMI